MSPWRLQKNRDLLLGRSMGHADSNAILLHLQKDPVVAFVTDTKTEEIGPGIFRFKAEVAWNGDKHEPQAQPALRPAASQLLKVCVIVCPMSKQQFNQCTLGTIALQAANMQAAALGCISTIPTGVPIAYKVTPVMRWCSSIVAQAFVP
eukprot:scaffold248160_cov17-Tisochrysis_lutea.AAC.1